jgi:predicted alpha/beta superfamily hydrolase
MNKKYFFMLIASILMVSANAQSKVLTKQTIKSNILHKEVHYTIYLPEGYEKNERTYPVTY